MLTVLENCADKFTNSQLQQIDQIAQRTITSLNQKFDSQRLRIRTIESGRIAEQQMLDRLQDASNFVKSKLGHLVR